jgi:hypothetical protein
VKTRKRLRLFGFLFLLLSCLFVLYPNPLLLPITVYRVFNPPIDPSLAGVVYLAKVTEEKTPEEIEGFIKKIFPYRFDWQVYNMPWYFPTAEEALESRMGDCKTVLVVFASVLEFQERDYSIAASPTHVWVNYPGKKESGNENQRVAMISTGTEEKTSLKAPRQVNWQNSSRSFWRGFWEYMPEDKRRQFLFCIALSLFFILFPGYIEEKFLVSPIKKR